MINEELDAQYFKDLYGAIETENSSKYTVLLNILFNTPFVVHHPMDNNRFNDGINLRKHWARNQRLPDNTLDFLGPCSIFEMMVALAMRIENSIMENEDYGDRTSIWFWSMITSLGLEGETDFDYDEELIRIRLCRFLNKEYLRSGRGGLFTTDKIDVDMRTLDIWYQAMVYINQFDK